MSSASERLSPGRGGPVASLTTGSPAVPVALMIASLALLPVLLGGYHFISVKNQIVLGSVTVLMLATAGLILVTALPDNAQGLARWRLGPWFLIWSGLSFGAASLTWLGPQTGSAAVRISLTSVPIALGIVAAALAAWTVGYVAGPPAAVRGLAGGALGFLLRGTSTRTPGAGTPWLLYGVGTAARLASVALGGGFGYVGDPSGLVTSASPYAQALSTVSMLAVFGIAVAAHRTFTTKDRGSRLAMWTLVLAEIAVGAVSGGKQAFVVAFLAVLIPFGAARGALSLRVILTGAVGFLLVVLPFNADYRSVVRSGHENLTPAQAAAVAPEILSDVVATDTPSGVLADSTGTLLRRLRMIDSVALIAQLTPSVIPYRNPADYLVAPAVGVVPRAVWPDKPIMATGYAFSQEYYGLPSTVYTSSAITPLGDLYRHGGWYVLIVGALLFGLGCRLFDTLFRAERDLRAVFFLLVFLPVVVKSEVDMYTILVGVPTGLATAVLGAQLACRARPGGPQSNAGSARQAKRSSP